MPAFFILRQGYLHSYEGDGFNLNKKTVTLLRGRFELDQIMS